MIPTKQLEARAKMLSDALADFARDCPGVLEQLRLGRVDGFPASTLGGGAHGSDPSDPTGRAVVAASPRDPNAEWKVDPAGGVLDWLAGESSNWVALARWLDRVRQEWKPYREQPKPCDNPWCPDKATRAPHRRFCEACRKFKERHGVHRSSPTALSVVAVSQCPNAAGRPTEQG